VLYDRELLASVGRVVVDAALLEYAVATFDAAAEGLRGQACEDRALDIIKYPGRAMKLFKLIAAGRPHLRWLAEDTDSVLAGRHFIAHAVAQEPAVTDDGEAALFILAARLDEPETMVIQSQLENQARLLRDACARIDALTKAEITGQPPGPPLNWANGRMT
jgi:hypothetical protein